MLKKVLATLSAVVASAAIALGANLSLLSGPQDPSQLIATLNTLIQNINAGVTGVKSASITSVSSSATTAEQTLFTQSLPANTISANGQGLRVKCWGTTGANGNTKTMKLYFGDTSVATPGAATNNKGWLLTMDVWRTAAATQQTLGTGLVDTTAVTPAVSSGGTDSFAAAVTIKCTGTQGTASAADIVANGMVIEQLK